MQHANDVHEMCQELSRRGVMPGRLSGRPDTDVMWEAQFFMVGTKDKDAAKEGATWFLKTAYDASHIRFFQKYGSGKTEFFAKFMTAYL